MQALYHRRVAIGHAAPERLRAPGRRNPFAVHQVLRSPGDSVERPAIFAGGDLRVGALRLLQREIARERDGAAQLRVEALEAIEIDLRQPRGGERARLDPAGERAHRRIGDVRLVARQSNRPRRAHEAIARRLRASRNPARGGRFKGGDLLRSGPPLIERSHRFAPVAGRLRALLRRVLHLHQLLRLGEGSRGHFRSDRRRGAERGRRSGRLLPGVLRQDRSGEPKSKEFPARAGHVRPQSVLASSRQRAGGMVAADPPNGRRR